MSKQGCIKVKKVVLYLNYKRMKELIVKLETLKESKERKDVVQKLRDGQEDKNKVLLE